MKNTMTFVSEEVYVLDFYNSVTARKEEENMVSALY